MTVSTGTKRSIFFSAPGVVLNGDTSPVIDSVAQSSLDRLPHQDLTLLPGSLGNRRDARQASQSMIISSPQSIGSLCEQRGENDSSDARQGSQDRHVTLLPELMYDVFLQMVFVNSLWRIATNRAADWGHVQRTSPTGAEP